MCLPDIPYQFVLLLNVHDLTHLLIMLLIQILPLLSFGSNQDIINEGGGKITDTL